MRQRRSGHIVNFSSIGGLVSFAATGYYHATKYAVEGLSESLSIELAPLGIKVLIVELVRSAPTGRDVRYLSPEPSSTITTRQRASAAGRPTNAPAVSRAIRYAPGKRSSTP